MGGEGWEGVPWGGKVLVSISDEDPDAARRVLRKSRATSAAGGVAVVILECAQLKWEELRGMKTRSALELPPGCIPWGHAAGWAPLGNGAAKDFNWSVTGGGAVQAPKGDRAAMLRRDPAILNLHTVRVLVFGKVDLEPPAGAVRDLEDLLLGVGALPAGKLRPVWRWGRRCLVLDRPSGGGWLQSSWPGNLGHAKGGGGAWWIGRDRA